MNTSEIHKGIREASCKAELKAHADLLDKAVAEGECDYSLPEAIIIEHMFSLKGEEFIEHKH